MSANEFAQLRGVILKWQTVGHAVFLRAFETPSAGFPLQPKKTCNSEAQPRQVLLWFREAWKRNVLFTS